MKNTLLLIATFLFSFCITVSASDEGEMSIARAILGCDGLGIMCNQDEQLTRAEMAEIMCKMINLTIDSVTPTYPEYADQVFNDVERDYWAYDFIYILSCIAVIQGDGDGNFRPNDLCTYSEMIKMVIGILGREIETWQYGRIYPQSYLKVAEKIGICVNAEDSGKAVTLDSAYSIAYKAINAETLEYRERDLTRAYLSAPSLLEKSHNIYQVTGYAKKINDSILLINEEQFKAKEPIADFDEGYILCFYHKNEDSGEKNIVIYVPVSGNGETVQKNLKNRPSGLLWFKRNQ